MTKSFVKRLLTLLYLLPKAKLSYESLTLNKIAKFLKARHCPPSSLKHNYPLGKHLSGASYYLQVLWGITFNISELVSSSARWG